MLAASGAVGFTDATRAIADPVVMRRLLSYASMFGKPVIQHPEEPSLAREGCATEGETATRLGLPGIPACAEVMLIERRLSLVRQIGRAAGQGRGCQYGSRSVVAGAEQKKTE